MSLGERFEGLGERERKLLVVFLALFGVLFAVLVPLWVRSGVSDQAAANEALSEIINDLSDERLTIAKRKQVLGRLDSRYRKTAPALAGFLANIAERVDVDIPETQDRSIIPHGKVFKERQTRIRLTKVGMRKLSDFMDGIVSAGYPVAITHLDIKKRGTNPDEFDAEMDVSAFDREEAKSKPKPAKKADKAASDEDEKAKP
jgi:hypothetical protein